MTTKTSKAPIDPLREFLDAVVTRIEALETHCGISSAAVSSGGALTSSSTHTLEKTPSTRHISGAGDTPATKAFDKYLNTTVYNFSDICDDLEMGDMGQLLVQTFSGMKYVVVLASKSKLPDDMTDFTQQLSPLTGPVGEIRKLRLSRDFDNHQKAIMEMLTSVSWVTCRAPAQLPAPFVKDCIGSSDFWSNRIRKDFKGKEDDIAKKQLEFCDSLKKTLQDLASYIEEFHKTGLEFNPKGVSVAEAAIRMSDNPLQDAAIEANRKKDRMANRKNESIGNTVKGGNMAGLVSELANRRSTDGSSAATGLRKVTKDQQTWRKEFKGEKPKPQPVVIAPVSPKKPVKKKKVGLPILEYQERGTKWVIENHDKETVKVASASGVLEVEITDPKQQVYIFNCEEVTIKITGIKLKSIIVDSCTKVNVIFPTIISGCEIVNSKKIAVQTDGVCPVFTIDKTVGVTIYLLSEETIAVTSFTTSMSSEMNVSIPDGDDQKEIPIPEQFVHKIMNGSLSSEVSDLYH
ncbi:adenylate cyclase associated (CAP) C terminal-domain containing protein [Nitzschia inconspicua]|uniref:Adenylate cyclase associated (CAP) C terminal-domain containing protein n=1 Tax=Nitzschia inconspicua TaxID=303405 RepID=A0A9K3KPR7_9STRA|nr:adenylate cyclase associated (CAP) C terminal-domain containing protein [Nitzschia inconspicua]